MSAFGFYEAAKWGSRVICMQPNTAWLSFWRLCLPSHKHVQQKILTSSYSPQLLEEIKRNSGRSMSAFGFYEAAKWGSRVTCMHETQQNCVIVIFAALPPLAKALATKNINFYLFTTITRRSIEKFRQVYVSVWFLWGREVRLSRDLHATQHCVRLSFPRHEYKSLGAGFARFHFIFKDLGGQ